MREVKEREFLVVVSCHHFLSFLPTAPLSQRQTVGENYEKRKNLGRVIRQKLIPQSSIHSSIRKKGASVCERVSECVCEHTHARTHTQELSEENGCSWSKSPVAPASTPRSILCNCVSVRISTRRYWSTASAFSFLHIKYRSRFFFFLFRSSSPPPLPLSRSLCILSSRLPVPVHTRKKRQNKGEKEEENNLSLGRADGRWQAHTHTHTHRHKALLQRQRQRQRLLLRIGREPGASGNEKLNRQLTQARRVLNLFPLPSKNGYNHQSLGVGPRL